MRKDNIFNLIVRDDNFHPGYIRRNFYVDDFISAPVERGIDGPYEQDMSLESDKTSCGPDNGLSLSLGLVHREV